MSERTEDDQTHEFRTVSTKDLHVGKVVALRLDEVEMPDGSVAKREVVEHLGAVAIVAVDDEGRLVLIRQYRHPLGRRLWELPAGLIDHAGEDPLEAAKRELVEEVGLAAAQWSVLVDIAASPGFTDEVIRVFLATGLSVVDREVLGEEEADLVAKRFPLAEAVRMVLAGEILNGPAVGGILAARTVLDGGGETRPTDAPWRDRPTRMAKRGEDR
ncbi:NUDIX domain-containing protein [Labedaea rhizosphaerae]|uniref:ADP-ribose pyrophosphatase n=1 Tax=Labedaea rhizosphaerae TaxID=598644 RepID=A0A4R6RUA8_LABRH|nr:NUDIX hydrolase [Labedaea rhizosphaerae]TDP90480.1 ADP-ribose pyrophosphatase [Labedaea rhizosphaerae]